MRLQIAHRILISAAITLGGVLLLYGISQYLHHGNLAALGTGVGGALASIALGLYLRWFIKKSPPT